MPTDVTEYAIEVGSHDPQLGEMHSPSQAEGAPSVDAGFVEVSTATRLLGDRWSLLIVRELAVDNTRFNQIHRALPGLSRSLLTSRLRYLERLNIIERQEIPDLDRRSTHQYSLTKIGWALTPVLRALGDWALAWQIPPGQTTRVIFP
jgi:DNA-binding HxlR family transcriptional regulator